MKFIDIIEAGGLYTADGFASIAWNELQHFENVNILKGI